MCLGHPACRMERRGCRNGEAPSVPPGTDARAAGVPLIEFALLDVDRRRRTGVPEVVFSEGKTSEQTFALLAELRARDPEAPALPTRCPAGVPDGAVARFPGDAVHADQVAGTVAVGALPPARCNVLVVTAGTMDLKVARECAVTLAALGGAGRRPSALACGSEHPSRSPCTGRATPGHFSKSAASTNAARQGTQARSRPPGRRAR
jgi:hypothetical protein